MDANTIQMIVTNGLFPMVCCYFLFKQNVDFQKTITELTSTLKEISGTICNISRRLDIIENAVLKQEDNDDK